MRIIRYQTANASPRYGWIFENMVGEIEGSPFSEFRRGEPKFMLNEVRLLAPVTPSKIICVGRNYAAHAEEHNADVPETPLIFLKPPSSLIGHEALILLPPQSSKVEHEAELAVIIGKQGRWISIKRAPEYVFGYTLANDVTARDLQRADGQWTRGKGFDTFCSVGPWIETDFDPTDSLITCHVNDELRQMASTRDMIFDVQEIVAFVSSVMTLNAGDLVLTGTPAGVGGLEEGDRVEVTIEGLGKLSNLVKEDSGMVGN